MSAERNSLFLERSTYRQRRLRDAARFLPVLGAFLFLVPLLWPQGEAGGIPTSRVSLYIFGAWAGLIVAAAMIARRLRSEGEPGAPADGRDR